MTGRAAAIGLSPALETAWSSIRAGFELNTTFWLAFVFGAQAHEVTELVARSRDLAQDKTLLVEQIPVADRDDVRAALRRLREPPGNALAGTWLVAIAAASRDRVVAELLTGLNRQRDTMVQVRPSGLLIALPSGHLSIVRDRAPDLWSFRSVVAIVEPATQAVPAPRIASPPDVVGLVDRFRPEPGPPARASDQVLPLLQRAAHALRTDRFDDALAAAQEALSSAGTADDNALAHAWLARARDRQGEPREAARLARIALDARRPLENATAEALLDILARSAGDDALAAGRELVRRDRATVEAAPGADWARQNLARSLARSGRLLGDRGVVVDALDQLHEAADLRRAVDPADVENRRERAATLEYIAQLLPELGRLADAQRAIDEAVGIRRSVTGPDDTSRTALAQSLLGVGDVALARGLFDDAATAFDEAIDLLGPLLASRGVLRALGTAHSGLAHTRYRQGDLAAAVRGYDDAVTTARRSFDLGPDRATLNALAQALGLRSGALAEAGSQEATAGRSAAAADRLEAARRDSAQALELRRRDLEAGWSDRSARRELMTAMLDDAHLALDHDDEEARSAHHQALDMARGLHAEDVVGSARDLSTALLRIADPRVSTGDDRLAYLREAVELRRRIRGRRADATPTDDADLAEALACLADGLGGIGDDDAQLAVRAEVAQLRRRVHHDAGAGPVPTHELSLALLNQGLVQERIGDLGGARRTYGEAATVVMEGVRRFGRSAVFEVIESDLQKALGRLGGAT